MPLSPSRALAAGVLALALLAAPSAARAADSPETPGTSGATPKAQTATKRTAPESAPVATVNGVPITRKELNDAMERLPAQYRQLTATPEGRKQILDNLILSRLLFARAKAQGFEKDAKVRAQVAAYAEQAAIVAMMQQVAEKAGGAIPEPDVKKYYDENPEEFAKSQEQVRASHILVETEADAARVRQEVAGGQDFADVAKRESKDQGSAARGGDLGYFTRARMVPEFADAAFALQKAGDLSAVVKTQFGYHVIKLTDRKPAEQAAFPEVKERIEAQLREERQQQAIERFVNEVRSKATIQIDEARLTD